MADSDKTYVTASGFIQFDLTEREANGKKVKDATIKTEGGDGKYIKITLWPEFEFEQEVERGDWLGVDGVFESKTYQDKEGASKVSYQINAYRLTHVKGVKRAERSVESSAGTTKQTTKVPF